MLDNWQRIEKIVNWTGLSVNAFARGIGLKRAENLYQIKKGNHGISRELAELICAKYPTVDKAWLLTGLGEMFAREDKTSSFPFYRVDAVRLLSGAALPDADSWFSIPLLEGCELAALHTTRAMEPEIPAGAIVMLRKADPAAILPGNTYLVISAPLSGIRVIRREPGSRLLRLAPRNHDEFDQVEIDLSQIRNLYEVTGQLVIK
jgi:hypothetical protein